MSFVGNRAEGCRKRRHCELSSDRTRGARYSMSAMRYGGDLCRGDFVGVRDVCARMETSQGLGSAMSIHHLGPRRAALSRAIRESTQRPGIGDRFARAKKWRLAWVGTCPDRGPVGCHSRSILSKFWPNLDQMTANFRLRKAHASG